MHVWAVYDKRAGFMPIKVVVRENYKHTFTTSIKYKVGSLDGRKNHKQNKKQRNMYRKWALSNAYYVL